jgi:hypothetical protein
MPTVSARRLSFPFPSAAATSAAGARVHGWLGPRLLLWINR